MLKPLRRAVAALAAVIGLSVMLAVAGSTAPAVAAGDEQIAQALRAGGLVILVRHGATFPDQADTAVLVGFKDVEKTADLTEGGLVVSPNENNRRAEALRKMLTTAPKPGTNTILITHYPNIIAALGKDWFDVKEGEASIFRPENGSYTLVARLQMEDWPRIAVAAK